MQNQDYGIGEAGAEIKQKVSEFGAKAADVADTQAAAVAEGFEEAAARVRERIGRTAEYFREHGLQDMAADLKSYVKAHPTHALVGATVLGFLAGRLIRRN